MWTEGELTAPAGTEDARRLQQVCSDVSQYVVVFRH